MNFFYLFTILFVILSLQKNINNIKYTIYYFILLTIYGYFYFNSSFILENQQSSLYENLLYNLAPFVLTILISVYVKFETAKNKKNINELDDRIKILNTKVKTAIVINTKVKTERKEVEKRLISEEKESIKIREIIEEISDFDLEKIEKNLLNYFQRLLPNAKMVFYKNEDNSINYKVNNYDVKTDFKTIDNKLLNILKNDSKDVISQLDYPEIKEKLLIKINSEKELFGVITVNYIDFKYINRVTIQSLNYFTKLLSLQIQNTIIYHRQKELSYSYNSKNIYNLFFLKKMIDLRYNLAVRENITSYLIIIKSDEFISRNEQEENKLFDNIENLYTRYFRKEDFVFYNQQMNSFIFLLITDDSKVNNVINKIETKLDNYDFSLEKLAVSGVSDKKDILAHVGIN